MEGNEVPIRIGGLSSGLPANLVDQVIEAERMPVRQMEVQKNKVEDKLKLVTDFETKINDISKNLQAIIGAKGFVDKKLSSSFPDILNGTVDPEVADAGEWTLEVMQLAGKPSVVTGGFPDKDKTTMGVGYLKFDTADGEKEVYIDEDRSTLAGMASAINQAGIGIRATVVNDRSDKEDSYRLEIAGLKTGEDNQVKFPTVYLLDGKTDFQFIGSREANSAVFKLDGHTFEATENVITDLIPGVSLDLKRAQPGQVVRMNITENYDVISEKIKTFVDSYNAALGFIQGQSKLVPGKDGLQRLGPLGGDSMLRMTQSRLREIIQDTQMTESKFSRVNELGVEYNRNGTLNFNAEKFKKIVIAEPLEVIEFLRGDRQKTGFITNMKTRLGQITDPQSGVVSTRKKNMQDQSTNIDKKIERKEKYLEKREDQLRNQFAKMEEAMSKVQSQGAGLAQSIGGR